MKTITKELYEYTDLIKPENKKILEKVLNENYNINVDHNWWNFTYDDAKEIGLKITSFDLDRNRHATGGFILSANEVAQNIMNNHGECCQTYKTAESFMNEWQPIFNDYMDSESENYESNDLEQQLIEVEDNFLNSLVEDYSIILQNESEYLMSEKAILETIQANEYTFNEYGKIEY